jgi:hypothetical protein
MFILSRNKLPETPGALAAALEEAVREFASRAEPMTVVRGADLHRLDEIIIDLSGAVIDPRHRPVPPKLSSTEPAISVQKLSVSGRPVKILGSEFALDFAGSNIQLTQAKTSAGKILLVLHQAESGEMRVQIAREEVERLIAKIAAIAAAKQGVTIDNVQVDLTSRAARVLEAKVTVSARKLFFRISLRLSGTVAVTDDLVATFSDLRCEGDGTIAALACAAIAPHFSRIEERVFPLSALPIGEVRVNDVAIMVDDKQIVVEARFGSQTARPS